MTKKLSGRIENYAAALASQGTCTLLGWFLAPVSLDSWPCGKSVLFRSICEEVLAREKYETPRGVEIGVK